MGGRSRAVAIGCEMPCFHPLPAWKARRVNVATGKRPISFRLADGFKDMPVELPCGKCSGCVQARASEWALRCEHEAKQWDWNFFLTLTYDNDHLPRGGSLSLHDLQTFWKRARLKWPGFRYFACGEYGEQLERPHYHALLFNFHPGDLVRRDLQGGKLVYESRELTSVWGLGLLQLDPFSGRAAQYVCNYVRKRVVVGADAHYDGRLPEFQVMSRRPGIGSGFISKFVSDVYPDGFVTRPGGGRCAAPRYYDTVLERVNPRLFRKVKRKRAAAAAVDVNRSGSRLIVREAVEASKASFFDKGRSYERGSL
jgi:hypothetical protein